MKINPSRDSNPELFTYMVNALPFETTGLTTSGHIHLALLAIKFGLPRDSSTEYATDNGNAFNQRVRSYPIILDLIILIDKLMI